MSGGVGPTCNDISLPKEEESLHKELSDRDRLDPLSEKTKSRRKTAAFLSFRQLNALAVIIIFSASGMVCFEDLAFVLFSIIYMYFISKIAFPNLKLTTTEATVFNPRNKILRLYILFAGIIGLLLPIAYILEGIFEDDKEGIKAASPHVFLLASQVFMEGVASSDRFSIPIRVFVPVFYNSRRIFTIAEWLRDEFAKEDKEYSGSLRRLYVGKALAVGNMALWCFNLFGFLLPFYLPKAFKKYYSLYKPRD